MEAQTGDGFGDPGMVAKKEDAFHIWLHSLSLPRGHGGIDVLNPIGGLRFGPIAKYIPLFGATVLAQAQSAPSPWVCGSQRKNAVSSLSPLPFQKPLAESVGRAMRLDFLP